MYTIKGVAGENYNQLTPEEQAQVQAAGTAAQTRYLSNFANPTSLELSSGQNEGYEAAQRFAESIFTQRSNNMQKQNEQGAVNMNTFIAQNPNASSLPTNIDPTGQYSIVNGVLTLKSAISADAANKAGVANGTLVEITTPSGAKAYVPTGSAGAVNIPNLGTNNTANAANAAPVIAPLPIPTSSTVNQGINLTSNGNLQLGTNSEQVRQLQTMLGITADGIFGPQTQAAVKAFQVKNGLTPDGVVGPKTSEALTKLPPTKTNNGITTPESVTQGTKIVVPPIIPGADNATPFVVGIQAAQDASVKAAEAAQKKAQDDYDSLSSTISGLLDKSGGQGQATLDAEAAAGVNEKQAALDEINSQIQTKLAQYNALNVDAQGKAVTMNSIIGAQAQIKNVAASEIGLLQAQASAMEGKLKLAKDIADRAVELKYADIKTQLDIKIQQLKLLGDTLTAKEKVTADLLDKQYKAQQLALSTQIANEKDLNATKLNQIQKYALTGVGVNNTIEEINAAVRKSAIYADEVRAPQGTTDNAGKSYTVSLGDVPESIANKLGLNVDTLLALNPGVNWNNLQKGQKLNVDTSKLSSVKNKDTIGLTSAKTFELQQLGVDIEAYISDPEYRAAVNSNLPN
jgi:peptidoglycan hydrolase-like protein with peptidoglycan-binding domain/LysM repeat protein